MEKRKHERAFLGVPVLCQSGQTKIEGMAENVSVGGLYLVRAAKTFPVNEKIIATFTIRGTKQALSARVVHEVPDLFMGLEFLNVPPKSKELIELHVATQSVP
ncbi:MAG: PilZ domain-containing protein [Acidobacteria bacterium]|nr:PilZ domain-containing protein [Acidobacteriota bacterium]